MDPTLTSRCTHLLCESQVSNMYAQVSKLVTSIHACFHLLLERQCSLVGTPCLDCKYKFFVTCFFMICGLTSFHNAYSRFIPANAEKDAMRSRILKK